VPRGTIGAGPYARAPAPPVVPPDLDEIGADDVDDGTGWLADELAQDRARLEGGSFTGLDLDLSGCSRVEVVESRVHGGSLQAGPRTEVSFRDCELVDVDLSALPAVTVVRRTSFRGCRLVGTVFSGGELEDVRFESAVLRYADFRLSRLGRVVFGECELADVDFYDASLTDVDLAGSRLVEVSFDRATCERVDLRAVAELGLTNAAHLRGCLITTAQAIEQAEAIALAVGIVLPTIDPP
jgi:uncharacterized protein YjbI with pentapeptide repeats